MYRKERAFHTDSSEKAQVTELATGRRGTWKPRSAGETTESLARLSTLQKIPARKGPHWLRYHPPGDSGEQLCSVTVLIEEIYSYPESSFWIFSERDKAQRLEIWMVEWDDGDVAGQPMKHTQSSLVPLSLLRPTGLWS